MKISELITRAEYALKRFGDLDCYVDGETEDECCVPMNDIVCEIHEDKKHLVFTSLEIEFTKLSLVK